MRLQHAARELLLAWAQAAPGQRPPGWRLVRYRSACRQLYRHGLPGRPGQPAGPVPKPFDAATLRAQFGEQLRLDLRWHCRSTLDGWRKRSLPQPILLLSESQSGGRGRNGRRWQSALTGNFYLSLLTPIETPETIGLLPLACGLAIAECLDPSGLQAQLKWPNDVLIDDRKLAGVLIELDTSRRPWGAAIGIGLNWHLPASERRRIDRATTDLHELLGAALPDRQQLLGELVLRLLGVIDDLRRGQGAELLRRWRARDALCNSEVELVNGDQRCCGVARSVDGSGRLQLQTAAGIQFWSAGEVERVLRSAACAAAG